MTPLLRRTLPVRALTAWLAAGALVIAPGCSAPVVPPDAGADARPTLDATPGLDAPAADVPGSDAPTASDAPASDAPTAPDGGMPVIRATHPRIYLLDAQLARLRALWTAHDPAAMRFGAMVDRQMGGGDVYGFAAWYAALMFQLTGEMRYAQYAIARVDAAVTAEEMRIAGGMSADVAGDSYLGVGDAIGDLALTYDWCFAQVSATQRTRWLAYANQAVWNVWNHDRAQWGGRPYPWSGWSVDDPVDNYYFSFLRATMLLGLAEYGESPMADGWITMFRTTKLATELVPVYARDLQGGGSREGTGYGVSMAGLFRLYDQWEASTGERVATLTGHAQASLPFMIHSTVPTLDRIAPIGDHARDSTAALFDYHRDYTQVLMWLFRDQPLAGNARTYLSSSSVPMMANGFMYYSDLLYANPALAARPLTELYPAYYAQGTGYVFVRTGWDRGATWANFIAGAYTESHAHQDQGSLLIYRNEWLAYDQNINSHSGIVQHVRAHNLVRVDQGSAPVEMREGGMPAQLLALHDDAVYAYFAANVAPVYDGRGGITQLDREVVFVKPDAFVVFDRVRAAAGTRRVFQLNTPVRPTIAGRVATIQGTTSSLRVHSVLPASAPLTVLDWAATDTDMRAGFRLDVTDASADTSLFLTVLSLDDTVASVDPADMTGAHGARVTFRDGRVATVRFTDASPGAQLDVRRRDGTTAATGAVPLRVDTLPLMAR